MAWPTTNDPKTEFVTLRLTVGEAAELDNAALQAGMKRSSYVREAVEEKIARGSVRKPKGVKRRTARK